MVDQPEARDSAVCVRRAIGVAVLDALGAVECGYRMATASETDLVDALFKASHQMSVLAHSPHVRDGADDLELTLLRESTWLAQEECKAWRAYIERGRASKPNPNSKNQEGTSDPNSSSSPDSGADSVPGCAKGFTDSDSGADASPAGGNDDGSR